MNKYYKVSIVVYKNTLVMIIIKQNDVGSIWVKYLGIILERGKWAFDSVEDILESDQIAFTMTDFIDHRGILAKCADSHIVDIYVKKMFSREIIPELNSTYGDRLFDNGGVDQILLATNQLKQNPWAKSCFIPLVVPNDPGPRVPCLSAIQLSIRERKLQMHATFRSQNAFNAYGNFLGMKALGDHVSAMLSVELGHIHYVVNFPHIYAGNIARAREIVSLYSQNEFSEGLTTHSGEETDRSAGGTDPNRRTIGSPGWFRLSFKRRTENCQAS